MEEWEIRKELENMQGFDWDEGNIDKNWEKHKVDFRECEEVFFNHPLLINFDKKHSSQKEKRYQALGKTDRGRKLFIAFTLRDNKIRIISARDQRKEEKQKYEKA